MGLMEVTNKSTVTRKYIKLHRWLASDSRLIYAVQKRERKKVQKDTRSTNLSKMNVKAREITLLTTSQMCRTETPVLRTMTWNAMVRQAVSTKAVFTQILILTPDQCSCAIMNKIHPSLQGDPSLPPQLLHSRPECFRRSFMNRGPLILPRIREERLVEIFRQHQEKPQVLARW